ncbi:hypothetical protein PTE30175_03636 [Pandoraea terrae]|uniref:DUF4148 domain-containing protein n=1 Tax=Pandoraea terrae TaxID=1537710 RepID=A0A5E4X880_9BURK|nr:DUF4148 domain-containing protein [Pandoraea terrae]VVE32621.1 hypothetical protein PTE30175_03636 [Pandoraea terrae]
MKALTMIAAAALSVCAAQAYAGDADVTTATSSNGATTTAQATSAPTQSAMPRAGDVVRTGKTREEVYQELIRAQKDGTMERLNALYGGG